MDWKVDYTFQADGDGPSNFFIRSDDGRLDVVRQSAGRSGTSYAYGDPGIHYLTVTADAPWTITVTALPPGWTTATSMITMMLTRRLPGVSGRHSDRRPR
jgi:hypothetical protein